MMRAAIAALLAVFAATSVQADTLFEALVAEAQLCPGLLDNGIAESVGRPLVATTPNTGVLGVQEREAHHPDGLVKLVFVEIEAQDNRLGFCGADTIARQSAEMKAALQEAMHEWHSAQLQRLGRKDIPCDFCPEFHPGVAWCDGGAPIAFTGLIAPTTGNMRIGVSRRLYNVEMACTDGGTQ